MRRGGQYHVTQDSAVSLKTRGDCPHLSAWLILSAVLVLRKNAYLPRPVIDVQI